MKNLKNIQIDAVDIPDAWFQAISNIIDYGFKYEIQHGSFIGQTRLEFDFVSINISQPYKEPYDLMLPQIPSHLNIPNPVPIGYIEQYIPYLMTQDKKENEEYTYGERITKKVRLMKVVDYMNLDFKFLSCDGQINYWIDILKKTPNTNQAVLQIARPSDCLLEDPPCLRHIDMRIKDGKLIFYPYFRSNDLWSGFPANLAGIAVLQKFMADEIGVEIGSMIYSSKGLHIYGYVEELAKLRCNKC